MQARSIQQADGFALYHRDVEIGSVGDGTVTFSGFTTEGDAALAASLAQHALRRRRARDGQRQGHGAPKPVATLRGRETPEGELVWSFDIPLADDERQGVFATSRARTMWAALRAAGLDRRMRQLHDDSIVIG